MLGGIFAQDLLGLAYNLRGVTAQTVSFFTAPVAGRGTEGTQGLV